MCSIDQNKIYKQEKKLEKLEKNYYEKIVKRKVYLDALRHKAIDKSLGGINTKYENKIAKFIKDKQRELAKKKREVQGKKALKKNMKIKGVKHWKPKAFAEVQKYSKRIKFDN